MKRLIVGDLHLGLNEKDSNFIDYQTKALDWIIDYANSNNLPCDFLGDLFDNRASVTHTSISKFKEILERINEVGVIVVGNHDTHYKNTSDCNIIDLLNNDYHVAGLEPVELGNSIYLPWVNDSTIESVNKSIKNTKKKICFGHLELSGFMLQKGIYSDTSHVSKSKLKKFDLVVSGHYHLFSKQDNIVYLGTPYQTKLYDVGVDKYIMVLDDETGEYELIKNPYTYFVEVVIDNEDDLPEVSALLDKKVKVHLNVARTIAIEKWLNELVEGNANVSIQDNHALEMIDLGDDDLEIHSNSVEEVWDEYVTTIEIDSDINEIDAIFKEELNKIKQGDT